MTKRVSLPLFEGGIEPPQRSEAVEVARQVNATIYEMAARLDELVRSEEPMGFLCECGCLTIAPVPVAEYETSGGAWLPNHNPSS